MIQGDTFPAELREPFLARSRQVQVRAGHIICAEGSDSTDVYLIRSGRVRISLFSMQGREVILRDMGAGHLFGEIAAIDAGHRSANVTAIEDGSLAYVRGDEFVDFLGAVPQAGLWMARRLVARVRDLTEKASDLIMIPVAGRVQGELLRLAHEPEAGAENGTIVITPMPTHSDIAARIGTHREAVTRELNLLAKERIIRQSGRSVEILALERLQAHHDRFRRV